MTRSHWKVKIAEEGDRCWETPRCVIHNRYGVSDPCVSQNSCEISAPQLAHKLHSVMNCDARYASARSELALIEIFVNLGKMKSVLIRVRPICLPCARWPGQVRLDYLKTLRCFLRYVLIYTSLNK